VEGRNASMVHDFAHAWRKKRLARIFRELGFSSRFS